MLLRHQIEEVIDQQTLRIPPIVHEVRRVLKIKPIDGYANIITGIRRCGKSTLIRQISRTYNERDILCLNFEDIGLTGFESDDFKRLHELIVLRKVHVLMFDEIQIIQGWEVFIQQLLRESYLVFITGSNASMLSVELGTNLTGRHISSELFPFSYSEYLSFTKDERNATSILRYLHEGGMPEYLANHDTRILTTMLEDILIRDIAIRYGIKNITPLKKLAIYLLSNIAKPFTGNRLTSVADNLAASTTIDYINYMRNAYLIDTIGQYSPSLRITQRNPKKVYATDTGIARSVSFSPTDDTGRLLENFVFNTLRRGHKDHIFYYKDKGECDFVITSSSNKPQSLYQVCTHISSENIKREIDGLREAMKNLQLNHGTIVTLDTNDEINSPEGTITMVSAFEFNVQN